MTPSGTASSPSMCRRAAAMLLLVCARAAWPAGAAQVPAPAASAASAPASVTAGEERGRIVTERADVEARFASRERECRQRFIVTSCLNEAKADRRQALDRLRTRQIALDEVRRQERSEVRRAELQEKATEDARRESARAAQAAASATPGAASGAARGPPLEARPLETHPPAAAASGPHDHARSPASSIDGKPRAPESPALRDQQEAASRTAFEARQADAAQHRQLTTERTNQRAAQKPPAAPLPVPAAASAVSTSARPAS
jgi:colicin import membrane protein